MSDLIPPGTTPQSTAYTPYPLQPASQLVCRFCGNGPAVQTSFRQHTGMILVMKFGGIDGPFCRNCGLYAFRSTMSHTMLAGWWSWLSLIAAPITMLVNLVRREKVAKLPPPMMTPGGRPPVDPGKPLYQRAAIIGLLLPVLVIGGFAGMVLASPSGPSGEQVGSCIRVLSDGSSVTFVNCSRNNDGQVTAIVDSEADCPTGTIAVVQRSTKLYCIGASPAD